MASSRRYFKDHVVVEPKYWFYRGIIIAISLFVFLWVCIPSTHMRRLRRTFHIGCYSCVTYDDELYPECTGSIEYYMQQDSSLTQQTAQQKVFDEGFYKCPSPLISEDFPDCITEIKALREVDPKISLLAVQMRIYRQGQFRCPDPSLDKLAYPQCEASIRHEKDLVPGISVLAAQKKLYEIGHYLCPDPDTDPFRYPECAGAVRWYRQKEPRLSVGEAQARVVAEGGHKCPPQHPKTNEMHTKEQDVEDAFQQLFGGGGGVKS